MKVEVKLKKCNTCKVIKSATFNFTRNKRAKDGFSRTCKDCQSKKRSEKTREILNYASAQGCISCGEKNPLLLEFDHEESLGEKKFNISQHHGVSNALLKEELEKCVVRCVSCHRVKTAIDFNWYEHIPERDEWVQDYLIRLRRL